MEELLGLVRNLGSKAPNNTTLQTKSSSVAKLLSSQSSNVSNEESVRVYQMFRNSAEKIKLGDAESAIQVLEQIQVAMDPQIKARAEVRTKALDKLFEGPSLLDQAESLTVRLSLASNNSLAASELQAQLQGFYQELGQLEQKLKADQEPGSPQASLLSQASLLRSVLDSESPIDRARAQAQIESFMTKLENLRTEITQGKLLESEKGSTFSSESAPLDPLASPGRPQGPPSASWLSEGSNIDGPGVREWLDKMYDTLGKLEQNLKSKPPAAPSVSQSAFESQSEAAEGFNQGVAELPAKLDFKKSQSIGGKKAGLSIEVEAKDGTSRDPPKQHPQSTKHLPAIKSDKRLSGSRQYISTGRQIGGKDPDSDVELDPELEPAGQHSAGNEDHEDDDQSLFSNQTPRYFYELRAGEGQGSGIKPGVSDFDSIPYFSVNAMQPNYVEAIPQNSLQFEQTRMILAKSATSKNQTQRSSTDFLDSEFKPWFLSIVGEPSLPDNLGLSAERRLHWKRAKYFGISTGGDAALRLWLPEGVDLPQRSVELESGLAESPTLANLLTWILRGQLLKGGICSFLGDADLNSGKYTFVLYNHAGQRVKVLVDDFLPVLNTALSKFSSKNLAFLSPLTLSGLEGLSDSRVEHVHFILPCLLEKALAKLFGNYLALHRSHFPTLLQSLLGPSVFSFQVSSNMPSLLEEWAKHADPIILTQTRPTKRKLLDQATYSAEKGYQVGEQVVAALADLYETHSSVVLHGYLPGLCMSSTQFKLHGDKAGLGLKLSDGAKRGTSNLTLSFKFSSNQGCQQALFYGELLGSKNLQDFRTEHGLVQDVSDWVIPWAALSEEELFLVLRVSPEIEAYAQVSEGVQIRELDQTELAKVKRGIVRKHNNQQPEMLKEFFTQSFAYNGSLTFKIHNPELVKGKLGTLVGAVHKADWMIEHNGVTTALKPTTVLQPSGSKTSGYQQLENVNLVSLEGIDVETLRVYPARKTSWAAANSKEPSLSLDRQLEQIRLVFN